ncbi:transposase [Anabaena minutissima FACHB-250]|nr:transposase [Anabaena minutissima FACHB-250]
MKTTGIDHIAIILDVGLEFFYSDSNGHHEPNPRFLRKAEKSIKHAQCQIIFDLSQTSLA